MALGYGSEFQLLRYLGHHRNYLNDEIRKVIGDGPIEWLDYPVQLSRDSHDGELCGINCFKDLSNFKSIQNEWKHFWPQSGNAHNWDGIFIQNGIWYFVEAKANLEEANQMCSAKSAESIKTIIKAFEETCGDHNLAVNWQESDCYQLANRLAFVHFCNKKEVGITAKLLYISFINGYEINPLKNVTNIGAWKQQWDNEFANLRLSEELKANIKQVYIDCHKPEEPFLPKK